MLLSFSVENYKIFKDRTTLSMDASADKDLTDNCSELQTPNKKYKVLRSAMVYGANASGKTKLFEALQLMGNFVCGSQAHRDDRPLNHSPYPGSDECKGRPTTFEVDYIDDGIRYVYGFSYDSERITDEHLYHYPKGKEALVFKREMDEYTFNSDKSLQSGNSRRVGGKSLYISIASQFNHDPSKRVVDWFRNNLVMIINARSQSNMVSLLERIERDERFREYTNRALRIADLGIDYVYEKRIGGMGIDPSNPYIMPERTDIWVSHRMNDVPVELELGSESSGTIRFLAIIESVIDSLLNGKTLMIDEMDLSFHTDLCRWVVGLFLDPAENRKGAQLIFNTHDIELLDLNKVRRDQIWFVSKDHETSVATLARLSDYKGIRKDLDIKKAYVNGSFGAKPFIEPSTLLE